jgi:hypothetical protein
VRRHRRHARRAGRQGRAVPHQRIAEIVGLRTTWFADPHGLVFILLEKRDPEKPYFAQY